MGESAGVIFKAILDAAPTPAVRLNPDVPADLERIIKKALEKDRNLRYQHAADMRTDLQRLKRDSESGHVAAAGRSKLWKITRTMVSFSVRRCFADANDSKIRPLRPRRRAGREPPISLTARAMLCSTTR